MKLYIINIVHSYLTYIKILNTNSMFTKTILIRDNIKLIKIKLPNNILV